MEARKKRAETNALPEAGPPATSRRASPAERAQGHFVQRTHEGDFLTERRTSGSQPFRCPKDSYDAAAEILARADQTFPFDELLDRMNKAMGDRPADYGLRARLGIRWGPKCVER